MDVFTEWVTCRPSHCPRCSGLSIAEIEEDEFLDLFSWVCISCGWIEDVG